MISRVGHRSILVSAKVGLTQASVSHQPIRASSEGALAFFVTRAPVNSRVIVASWGRPDFA